MKNSKRTWALLLLIIAGSLSSTKAQRVRSGDASFADQRYDGAIDKRVMESRAGGGRNVAEGTCVPERHEVRTIIKTKDSIAQGAIFLQAPANLSSTAACLRLCCSLPSCTTAIVKRDVTLACYLFDCRQPTVCVFSTNNDFEVTHFIHSPARPAPTLDNQGQDQEHAADLASLAIMTTTPRPRSPTHSTTIKLSGELMSECVGEDEDGREGGGGRGQCTLPNSVCESGYCVCRRGYHTFGTQCKKDCRDYEFECTTIAEPCIAIYDQCDGIVQCRDGSDELNCPSALAPSSVHQLEQTGSSSLRHSPLSSSSGMQSSSVKQQQTESSEAGIGRKVEKSHDTRVGSRNRDSETDEGARLNDELEQGHESRVQGEQESRLHGDSSGAEHTSKLDSERQGDRSDDSLVTERQGSRLDSSDSAYSDELGRAGGRMQTADSRLTGSRNQDRAAVDKPEYTRDQPSLYQSSRDRSLISQKDSDRPPDSVPMGKFRHLKPIESASVAEISVRGQAYAPPTRSDPLRPPHDSDIDADSVSGQQRAKDDRPIGRDRAEVHARRPDYDGRAAYPDPDPVLDANLVPDQAYASRQRGRVENGGHDDVRGGAGVKGWVGRELGDGARSTLHAEREKVRDRGSSAESEARSDARKSEKGFGAASIAKEHHHSQELDSEHRHFVAADGDLDAGEEQGRGSKGLAPSQYDSAPPSSSDKDAPEASPPIEHRNRTRLGVGGKALPGSSGGGGEVGETRSDGKSSEGHHSLQALGQAHAGDGAGNVLDSHHEGAGGSDYSRVRGHLRPGGSDADYSRVSDTDYAVSDGRDSRYGERLGYGIKDARYGVKDSRYRVEDTVEPGYKDSRYGLREGSDTRYAVSRVGLDEYPRSDVSATNVKGSIGSESLAHKGDQGASSRSHILAHAKGSRYDSSAAVGRIADRYDSAPLLAEGVRSADRYDLYDREHGARTHHYGTREGALRGGEYEGDYYSQPGSVDFDTASLTNQDAGRRVRPEVKSGSLEAKKGSHWRGEAEGQGGRQGERQGDGQAMGHAGTQSERIGGSKGRVITESGTRPDVSEGEEAVTQSADQKSGAGHSALLHSDAGVASLPTPTPPPPLSSPTSLGGSDSKAAPSSPLASPTPASPPPSGTIPISASSLEGVEPVAVERSDWSMPVPRGAVVALVLGIVLTSLLLLLVGCRVNQARRSRSRKGRPLSSNEADYLINGMYL